MKYINAIIKKIIKKFAIMIMIFKNNLIIHI